MAGIETITLRLRPRWWQFIRRWREWRARREMIGQPIVVNGVPYRIAKWGGATVTTLDSWTTQPGTDDVFLLNPPSE